MTAASTANDGADTLIGASGTVYVAPSTATVTAPAAERDTLDTDLVELGFITPDGVTITDEKEVFDVHAWQSPYPVRKGVSGRKFSVKFALEQWNWTTLPFAIGGGTLTIPTAGHYKLVPPDADDLDVRAMVIDWVDGTRKYRLWLPQGIVSAPVEWTVKRDEPAVFPITFETIYTGSLNAWELFTDDANFQNV